MDGINQGTHQGTGQGTETADQKKAAETAGTSGTPGTDDATGAGTGTSQTDQNSGDQEKKFSQAELNAILKDRLDRKEREAETKAAKDKEKADADKLKEQEKWKELADSNETKAKTLETQLETATASLAKLTEIVQAQLTADIKDWPDEVKSILPGADADLLVRYDAIMKAKPLAAKLIGAPGVPGNRPNPKPNGAIDNEGARSQVASFSRGRL